MCDKSESADVAGRVRTAAVVSCGILVQHSNQYWSEMEGRLGWSWCGWIIEIWLFGHKPKHRYRDDQSFRPGPICPLLYAPLGGKSIFPADGCALSHFNQLPTPSSHPSNLISLASQPLIRGFILSFVTFILLLICFDPCFHSCTAL